MFGFIKLKGICSRSLSKLSAFFLILQKSAVELEYGDATTVADPSDAQSVTRSFPLTYGKPLVHFLNPSSPRRDSQVKKEHPAIRYWIVSLPQYYLFFFWKKEKHITETAFFPCLLFECNRLVLLAFSAYMIQERWHMIYSLWSFHCGTLNYSREQMGI